MRGYNISEASEHEMKLAQMGGKVGQIHSKMCFVNFDIGGLVVEYVYNINAKDQFFLERIKPYPLALKILDTEDDVVKLIAIDLEQFAHAMKSKNITDFIKVGSDLNVALKKFEDLFLYYNISRDECHLILEKVEEVIHEVYHAKEISKRIYFEKEPDNL